MLLWNCMRHYSRSGLWLEIASWNLKASIIYHLWNDQRLHTELYLWLVYGIRFTLIFPSQDINFNIFSHLRFRELWDSWTFPVSTVQIGKQKLAIIIQYSHYHRANAGWGNQFSWVTAHCTFYLIITGQKYDRYFFDLWIQTLQFFKYLGDNFFKILEDFWQEYHTNHRADLGSVTIIKFWVQSLAYSNPSKIVIAITIIILCAKTKQTCFIIDSKTWEELLKTPIHLVLYTRVKIPLIHLESSPKWFWERR